MENHEHNMKEYTTAEAARIVGDISPNRVRQLAKSGEIDHKRFGRMIVITEAGIQQIRQRNTKPGPKTENGSVQK